METLEQKETAGSKKVNSRATEDKVFRGNQLSINPLDIIVNWETNARQDYGEDFAEFKESIKERSVLQNVKLFLDVNGKWNLRHGFRRMKAVLELISEGHVIERVPFDKVSNNEEEALIEHFVLNNGKTLNDVEMANGLKKLKALTGIDNIAELARRVSIPYQKAVTLMNFAEHAGTQVQQSILSGETSFDIGKKIVKAAGSISEQNEILKEGKENAQKGGKSKIRSTHIPIIHAVVTTTTSFDESLEKAMADAKLMPVYDKNFHSRVTTLIHLVKIGATEEEIKLIFIP